MLDPNQQPSLLYSSDLELGETIKRILEAIERVRPKRVVIDSHRVRASVDRETCRVVAIDSLNGYQAAMPEEQFLALHLPELLQYLHRRGTATFLAVAQSGMMADMRQAVDVTYLASSSTRNRRALALSALSVVTAAPRS